MFGNKNKSNSGFTLIELLVVVAIIALLSSIALIALVQARQKSRDAKRLGDLVQMNTGMELYFSTNKGYPSSTNGLPQGMTPQFLASLPTSPSPADGACSALTHAVGSCGGANQPPCGVPANTYYYIPVGLTYKAPDNITDVYPDYAYYFCLGQDVNNIKAGEHVLTPKGIR